MWFKDALLCLILCQLYHPWKKYLLPLIQEEQVVTLTYLEKNVHLILVNCPREDMTSSVYRGRKGSNIKQNQTNFYRNATIIYQCWYLFIDGFKILPPHLRCYNIPDKIRKATLRTDQLSGRSQVMGQFRLYRSKVNA